MPAWGLIPDSPWIYWGRKAARGVRRPSRRPLAGSRYITTTVKITFKGLVLYKPILNYELNVPTGMVGKYMAVLGERIESKAKRQVGVKTGALRTSIHTEHRTTGGRQYIKVGSKLHYAYMHHEGTRPHIISAKPPGVLRFKSKKGGVVHAVSVLHPGTKPNRYLSDQLRKVIR